MAPTIQELGLDRFSPEDRLAIAQAIWESVVCEAEAAPLPPAQRAELERRLADSIARPDAVTPWEVIKARALGEGANVTLPIVLRAEAEAEFDAAFDFYDAQQVGLGAEFAAEVQRVFDRVAANPLIHQVVFADIRKGVVRRFPFCVFYRSHADRVEVLSVFHTSRDPSVWQSRA